MVTTLKLIKKIPKDRLPEQTECVEEVVGVPMSGTLKWIFAIMAFQHDPELVLGLDLSDWMLISLLAMEIKMPAILFP